MKMESSCTNLTRRTGLLKHALLISSYWDVLGVSSLDQAASYSFHLLSPLCRCQESWLELDISLSTLSYYHILNK